MSDTTSHNERRTLAYIWSIAAILFLGYILYKWGGEKEILTLIIGMVSTVIGGIFGVYFGGGLTNKPTNAAGTTSVELSATTTAPDTQGTDNSPT